MIFSFPTTSEKLLMGTWLALDRHHVRHFHMLSQNTSAVILLYFTVDRSKGCQELGGGVNGELPLSGVGLLWG